MPFFVIRFLPRNSGWLHANMTDSSFLGIEDSEILRFWSLKRIRHLFLPAQTADIAFVKLGDYGYFRKLGPDLV